MVIAPHGSNARHRLDVEMPAPWTTPSPLQALLTSSKERLSSLPPFPEDRFIALASTDKHALDAAHDGAEVLLTTIPKPLNEKTWRRLECLRDIKHTHVQAVVGIFDADSSVCVVQTLQSATSTAQPLLQEVMYLHGYNEAQLRRRAVALLNALHALHSKDIVHGNLTLDSLFLFPPEHLVLHVPAQLDSWLTHSFPATTEDKSHDIFSFGIVLYLVASGRHPFATTATCSTAEILCNMDTTSFSIDKAPLRHLSPSAQQAILDCLAASRTLTTADLLQRQWFKTPGIVRVAASAPSIPHPSSHAPPVPAETYITIPPLARGTATASRLLTGKVARAASADDDTSAVGGYATFGHYGAAASSMYAPFQYSAPSQPPISVPMQFQRHPNASFGRDIARSIQASPSPATASLLPTRHSHSIEPTSDTSSTPPRPSTPADQRNATRRSPELTAQPPHFFRHVASMPNLHATRAVKFSAYGPPILTDARCRVFIWAYLAQQVDQVRELAAALHTIETGRLSKGLQVGFGATITIRLQPPVGWKGIGEMAKSLLWTEDIERVFFDVALDPDAVEWSSLCRARIVVGTDVAILHFALPGAVGRRRRGVDDAGDVEYDSTIEAVAPIESPMIPRHHLTLLEPVGSGFFGTAYKALHHPTNRQVVVKTLRQDIDVSKAEFEHEVRALTMLSHHPHVVDFLGACEDGAELSVVMEYVANGSLEAMVYDTTRQRHHSTFMKTLFARDAAHGILNIHQGRFVHRDIAARNCLVDDTHHVKVCDFGLSRPMDRVMGHLLDPVSAGPLKWMAPESLELPHVFSTASDTYMFGVLLFEIMMGKEPFPHLPPHEAAALVLEGHRLSLKEWKECPATHQDLLEQCFRLDPLERPCMGQVASILDTWLARQG